MPNWCYNVLTARGTKEEIDSFLAKTTRANQSTDFADIEPIVFDFNSIIPMPNNVFRGNIGQKEQDECAAQGIPNWYDWSIGHWGTKWNACHTDVIRESDDKVCVCFSTAWSYPLPVIRLMKIIIKRSCKALEKKSLSGKLKAAGYVKQRRLLTP